MHTALTALTARVRADAERVDAAWTSENRPRGQHRAVMTDILLLVVDGGAHRPALEHALGRLVSLQGEQGLFGGDNQNSAPDTSFTVRDICLVLDLIDHDGGLSSVRETLTAILSAAYPALITGGVHTPNHRWEVSAALARLHARWPRPDALARIDAWLGEGVDIDADGMYSERSALYAAHVTNDSLLTLADILGRPGLLDPVRRNLDAFLPLFNTDGTVETVHSRRQDQWMRQPASGFALQLRRFALADRRGDLAWWSEKLLPTVERPEVALSALRLDPALAGELPAAIEPALASTDLLPGSGLARVRNAGHTLTVFGGSDHSRHRTVRSGLSTNPTLLRLRAGDAELTDMRISPRFFGLGAFHSDGLTIDNGAFLLTQQLSAAYYHPLAEEDQQPDGAYRLSDDGRFSAAMSFDRRSTDERQLTITVMVSPLDDGADVLITAAGEPSMLSVELTFGAGTLSGAIAMGSENVYTAGTVRHTSGRSGITVTIDGDLTAYADDDLLYDPGEAYGYLRGTNATSGTHLYAAVRTPGKALVRLRAHP